MHIFKTFKNYKIIKNYVHLQINQLQNVINILIQIHTNILDNLIFII